MRKARLEAGRARGVKAVASQVTDALCLRSYGAVMAKNEDDDDKVKRRRCGACFGEGGEWEEANGQPGTPKKWKQCRACNGSGWQDG